MVRKNNSRVGENQDKVNKCSICGEKYTVHDPDAPNMDKKNGRMFRFPNEWNKQEIVAHKLGHVESTKARRVLGKILRLLDKDRKQVLDFIKDHYDG